MKRALLISCLVAATAFVACKQGQGERCQVNDDCVEPLICNRAKNICQGQATSDAEVEIPIDAMPDATPDAPPDAPPEP